MKKWINYNFESSSGLTEEFANFAKDFKKEVKSLIGAEYELASFNRGHFYISGFIKNKTTNKYAYFSISDVRGGDWNELLVRTATSDKDFRGGTNNFYKLSELCEAVDGLTA